MPCHLQPSSALYGQGDTSDYVVYHELILTTEYMRCVISVEPMFFSVKDSDTLTLEHKKEKEDKTGMEEEMEKLRRDQAELEVRKQRER